MELSKRLKTIADYIEPCNTILDIGCDHALLDIYLVQQNIVKNAVASEIHIGAYDQGIQNVLFYGLDEQIELRIGDGLNVLTDTDSIDTIIIAGMGGIKIIEILKSNMKKLANIETLVLQPNNGVPKVRNAMQKLGFKITEEKLMKENGIIYTILKVKSGEASYTESDCFFGPIIKKNKNELFVEYYKELTTIYQNLLKKIPQAKKEKRNHIENLLKMINEELN